MENYNGLTMSPSGDSQNVPITMNHSAMNEGYTHDPSLEFDQVMFNDLNVDLSQLPDFPTHEPYDFSANFEDPLGAPWANNASYFDGTSFSDPTFQIAAGAEPSPPDLDNKLLGFGAPIHKTPVIDAAGQSWPRLCAELNGMFSIAEDVFEGETTGRPLELTCYRRNLFQISGSVALSRSLARVVLDQGRNAQITELYASLSATESIEGKHTDVISVPWKTGIANGASSEDKSGTAPAPIPIDLSSNQESDLIQVTIPIAWRRLQFKYATANNGRRKGLQQHYQIQVALMVKVEGEEQPVKIAEIHSNNIVVRGRSPKNFDSSKDVPLSERKQSDPMNRRGQQGQGASISGGTPQQQQQQWGVEPAIVQASGKYYAQQSFQTPIENISSWPHMSPTPSHSVPITRSPPVDNEGLPPAKRSASTFIPSRRRPTSTANISNIPNMPRHLTAPETIPQIKSEIAATPSASHRPPIGLSLSDDSPPTHISIYSDPSQSPEAQHQKSPSKKTTPEIPPQATKEHRLSVTSPMEKESIDQLYEYFPLGLDDWMPPVNAIYRPHVVHHLKVAALGGPGGGGLGGGAIMFAGMGRQRPKRYFSGGDE